MGILTAVAVAFLHLDARATLQAKVDLKSAGDFEVLAASTITSTGGTVLNGNLGLSPGSAVTGFPPGLINGVSHVTDGIAAQAQLDLTAAYNDAAGRTIPALVVGGALGGLTLAPGLYKHDSSIASLGLAGSTILTLDAQGDPNAVWIFQADETVIAETGSSVVLINGAQACNVYWKVGSSATLRTGAVFKGNILAYASISFENLASLQGRALAQIGAVTFINNAVGLPCGPVTLTGVPANTNVTCDAIPAPAPVTAGNACSTQGTAAVMTETVLPGTCPILYMLQRVWTGSNACGDIASATQLVFVADAPAVFSGVPANTSASCDAIPIGAIVTYTNACNALPKVAALTQSVIFGLCPNSYTLQRVWTATNLCAASGSATQLIFVADTTAPVLFGVPADTSSACDAIPTPAVVTATDNCATGITVVLQQSVDTGGTPTSYTLRRVWSASDPCGNSTAATQLVAVSCGVPPPCGPLGIVTNCGGVYRSVKTGHLIIPLSFAVTNLGSGPASYTLSAKFHGSTNVVPWVILTPVSGIIPGLSEVFVAVTFTPSSTNLARGAYLVDVTVIPLCDESGAPSALLFTLQVGPDVMTVNDFDGDGTSDLTLYWPAPGMWYTIWSSCCNRNSTQFGWNGAVPVPGDFDGDGKSDIATFAPSVGMWYALKSDGGLMQQNWGWSETVPVPADYDGDGKTDIAVYWPAQGMWYILYSGGGSAAVNFGSSATIPVPGDYDGDGKADLAVYNPRTSIWYIFGSATGFHTDQFGFKGCIPVSGDFDGDGTADQALYYPPTGMWYIFGSSTGYQTEQFGSAGSIPVSGDFDGDGISDLAIYYPSSGIWYIFGSYRGFMTGQFGWSADYPTAENPRPAAK